MRKNGTGTVRTAPLITAGTIMFLLLSTLTIPLGTGDAAPEDVGGDMHGTSDLVHIDASGPAPSAKTKYKDTTVTITNLRVRSGDIYEFINCTIEFQNAGSQMVVEDGGIVNITGAPHPILFHSNITSKSGVGYAIKALRGSELNINHTNITAPSTSLTYNNMMELYEGVLKDCMVSGLRNQIRIMDGGVHLTDTDIQGAGAGGALIVDTNHSWSPDPTIIRGLDLKGTFSTALRVMNNSVWRPYDVPPAGMYYAGSGDIEISFNWTVVGYVSPYIKLPHFLDSRSDQAILSVDYNDGTWKSFSGFPKSNLVFTEWQNSDNCRIPLVGIPYNTPIRIRFTAPKEGLGCAYIGMPHIGGQGKNELPLTSLITEAKMGAWDDAPVTVPSLLIDDVKVHNGTVNLFQSVSSGMINISSLDLGAPDIGHTCPVLASISNSAVSWSKGVLIGKETTTVGLKVTSTGYGNDWAWNLFDNITMNNSLSTMDQGVDASGGWTSLNDMTIDDTHYAVRSQSGLLRIDTLDADSDSYGLHLTLPSSYPQTAQMDLRSITAKVGDFSEAGMFLRGSSVQYNANINILDCYLESFSSKRWDRSDSMGTITLDVTSDSALSIKVRGELLNGTGHGIAIKNWPATSAINIESTNIRNAPLDGIYMANAQRVFTRGVNIKNCGGWGIRTQPYSDLNMTSSGINSIDSNAAGGILVEHHSSAYMTNIDVQNNLGSGLVFEDDSMGTILGSRFLSNYISGIEAKVGTKLTVNQCELSSNRNGVGLLAKDTVLTIKGQSSSQPTRMENNAGGGLNMVGGSLASSFLKTYANIGDGIYLDTVTIRSFQTYEANSNTGNGLNIHVGSGGILPSTGNYCNLSTVILRANQGAGLRFSKGLSITSTIEVGLRNLKADSNVQGDLVSPEGIHLLWTMTSYDELGSETYIGKVVADLDIRISTGGSPKLRNENLSLLGSNNVIEVQNLATLNLKNCHIRPYSLTDRFTITASFGSKVMVKGGYLGYLKELRASSSSRVELDSVLVSGGEGGLVLQNSQIEIYDSNLNSIGGSAVLLMDSKGNITGSLFKDNQKGIEVRGVSQTLRIIDTEFIDNSWGLYLFSNKTKNVEIRECGFEGNSPAPIYLEDAKATLIDTSVDPYDLQVRENEGEAIFKYTLSAEVLDEEGDKVPFDIKVTRGSPPVVTEVKGIGSIFSREFESYKVRDPDAVDSTMLNVYVEIAYVDYSESVVDNHYSYEDALIVLDQKTHLVFNGYMVPVKTAQFDDNLLAYEDRGLIDEEIDLSLWFMDIGEDQGNLTFTVTSHTQNIIPRLSESVMTIELKQDWNGEGKITITATDPHWKSLSEDVTITVIPVNDPPYVENVMILSSDGSPNPMTGDVIIASWQWFDIDTDDVEPPNHLIQWFLDGVRQEEYDNQVAIPGVVSGDVWNFTITPADWHGFNYGDLGVPVRSPTIRIGNAPPVLNSISFLLNTPRTDNDLMVAPGSWNDPDSETVTFHYLWERRSGSNYIPIGAPDSPILDRRFTTKGDEFRVTAWAFDGEDRSETVSDTVIIRNTAPSIVSARLLPPVVDEKTERVYLSDIVWADPDGDNVYLTFTWYLQLTLISVSDSSVTALNRTQVGWKYPDHQNISVVIVPEDSDNERGNKYTLSVRLVPVDTDGDGVPDIDDIDDDVDGFNDEWEVEMGSDPKSSSSRPLDTDGDGSPDGNALNSKSWMDTDDDNDNIMDENDPYPKNPARPADIDLDGIGDDRDNDIDGDGVLNDKDDYPYDKFRWKEPEEPFPLLQVIILIMVLVIIAGAGALGYLVYTGTVKLPTTAPPTIEGEEAVFEEEKTGAAKGRAEKDLEELDDLDKMSVCSQCGELISIDALTCPNCGVQFEEEEEMEEMDEFEEDED